MSTHRNDCLTEKETEQAFALCKKLENACLTGQGAGAGKKARLVRQTEYPLPGATAPVTEVARLHSWRMSEFMYHKDPCPLPTLARGLFTLSEVSSGDKHSEAKLRGIAKSPIIVRGYQKFFNLGETHTTSLNWLESANIGPFEVTKKENGCIVFASAVRSPKSQPGGSIIFPDDPNYTDAPVLVVTSKHAMDKSLTSSSGSSHAQVAYTWLIRHLIRHGRTMEDFAAWLFARAVTAVFEVCIGCFH